MVSQSVFLNTFTLQLNASGAANQDYQLYTLEGRVQHTLSKALTLGAGIKYTNKQLIISNKWAIRGGNPPLEQTGPAAVLLPTRDSFPHGQTAGAG